MGEGRTRRRTTLRRLAAAAVLAGVAVGTPIATASPLRTGPALHVSGTAGTAVWVDVASGTQLSNAGSDTASTAGNGQWAGVALIKTSRDVNKAVVFVDTDIPQSARCPGSSCPWTVPPTTLVSTDDGSLPAGRYRLILLGRKGAFVHTAVHPTRGAITVVSGAPRPHADVVTAMTAGAGPRGHEAALHAFHSLPPGGGFALAYDLGMYAVGPAGVISDQACRTSYSSETIVSSVGGVAPCADFSGEDFFGPASIGPSTTGYGYAPVSGAVAAMWGRRGGDSFGIGDDIGVAAPSSYLADLFIGIGLPY